jgi:tRNA pseudouridine55 synthase
VHTCDQIDISDDHIQRVLSSFLGTSTQIPPMVSALSHQGKRLYQYHREGLEVERPARMIHISSIKLLYHRKEIISFEAEVSSGTYIRTLCEDIAEKLNTVGTMSALTRTKIGDVDLSQAVTLEQLHQGAYSTHAIEPYLIYPLLEYEEIDKVIQGKKIDLNSDELNVIVCHHGKAMAVYQKDDQASLYRCVRGLW